MTDDYISNINTDDIGEDKLLEKLKKMEAELSETKSKLDEKSKLCLDQKHQLEDLFIETKDLKEKYNNQQKLIKFYEDKSNINYNNINNITNINNINIDKKNKEEININSKDNTLKINPQKKDDFSQQEKDMILDSLNLFLDEFQEGSNESNNSINSINFPVKKFVKIRCRIDSINS